MAIAGIFVAHAPQGRDSLRKTLESMPQIVGVAPVDDNKLAIALETPAFELTGFLENLGKIENVLNLEVIYINYEDDLDQEGHMEAPPEARKHE